MCALYCCIVASVAYIYGTAQSSTPKVSTSSSSQTQAAKENAESDLHEEVSRSVVNQSLEIFKSVAEIFKKFAQSNVHQNRICMGTWMLLAGIQGALSASN